jgi:hypothetical protein
MEPACNDMDDGPDIAALRTNHYAVLYRMTRIRQKMVD